MCPEMPQRGHILYSGLEFKPADDDRLPTGLQSPWHLSRLSFPCGTGSPGPLAISASEPIAEQPRIRKTAYQGSRNSWFGTVSARTGPAALIRAMISRLARWLEGCQCGRQ